MMERKGNRHKHLLDKLKETREYWNAKREHCIALCGEYA
jgi:hypothetical protein